jgi:poly [ADP-ribose] polymerase
MAHTIEVAKSGRAACRTCKESIAKGELRFGEEVQNQFSDGPSLQWHHLKCAAKSKPAQLQQALAAYTGDIPDRAGLDAAIEDGKKHTKASAYPHADRAPTGRAKCMFCNNAIEKGAIRVVVEREVETGAFMGKSAGYLHMECAAESIEEKDLFDRVKANSTALSSEDLEELRSQLA